VSITAAAVEAVDVTRVYQLEGVQVEALRGVSLRIDTGEYVAVVGPSGSGKSTLMHLLGCLDRPSSGSLRIAGREVADLTGNELAALRNARVGFVFQSFQLLGRTTAVDNVALPLVYAGVGRAERRERAVAALTSVGLAHRLGHRPAQMSGGEQQRVAIARALVTGPAVVLADEPTGNLDTENSKAVLDVLRDLNRRLGQTILMITHNPEAAAYGDSTVHMRDGRIADRT